MFIFIFRAEGKIFINRRKVIWNVEAYINYTEKEPVSAHIRCGFICFFPKYTSWKLRVVFVHIKFSAVSLRSKTRTLFSVHYTSQFIEIRRMTLHQQVFSVTTRLWKKKNQPHLLCRQKNFLQIFMLVRCMYLSISGSRRRLCLQLSHSVYHWETDEAYRKFTIIRKN
jgi:hypothetical protein